jgi:hypothetical protein
MKGQRYPLLALAGVLLLATAASAQQPKPAAPAAPAPATAPVRLAPPARGDVELGYTKPNTKNDGKFIVTTFKVKNMSPAGSIAGLKIDEFWYDKKGDPVTGGAFRYRKPLQPGEVIEVMLRTPVNKSMDRNQYKFEHANGGIKPKLLPKL